ncbi:MAG: hypothetical protein U1F98_09715 [Verrucomicrobiota bacterium]
MSHDFYSLLGNIALGWLALGALIVIGHLTWLELRDIRKHRLHRKLANDGKHLGLVQTITVVTQTASTDGANSTASWTVSNMDTTSDRWTVPRPSNSDGISYRWN